MKLKGNNKSYKRHADALQKQVDRLTKENDRLRFENRSLSEKLYEYQVQKYTMDESMKTLEDSIRDVKLIREKYLSVLNTTKQIKNTYSNRFKKLISRLKSVN